MLKLIKDQNYYNINFLCKKGQKLSTGQYHEPSNVG